MRVYSFLNTVMLVNGVEITGWADGDDVINISRRNDSASDKIGADGRMMVSLSADRSGEATFKLQSTSGSNKFLSSLMAQQEGGTLTFRPISLMFQDVYRQDTGTGSVGYIKKPADIVRGEKAGNTEWTIVVEHLDMLLGDTGEVVI